MSVTLYPLKVSKVIRETPEAVSISFDVPSELKEIFRYKHGQFLNMNIKINGSINKRAYSISSSPLLNEDLTVTVKAVDNGFISNFINRSLKSGDIVEVMPPHGKFTFDVSESNQNQYIMFASGSGITPIISIIKSILLTESDSKILLFYINKSEESIIFHQTLNDFQKSFSENFKYINILSKPSEKWNGLTGRLDSNRVKELINLFKWTEKLDTHYFLCGHPGLMKEIQFTLNDLEVSKEKIHKETFTSGKENDKKVTILPNNDFKEIKKLFARDINIRIYGENFKITVQPDETILTAAISQNLDPPFSCQIGTCATCRARLVSGEVIMDERDALTDEEIAEKYILTCQSHPITDDVTVDYDDN